MGCTSSAPNMPTPLNSERHASKSEDEIKEMIEDANEMYAVKENETNSTNVLPTCDKLTKPPSDMLDEPTALDRNYKSFIHFPPQDTRSDREQEKELVIDLDDNKSKKDEIIETPESETSRTDDKITTLDEVVEQAVEFFLATQNTENNAIENTQNNEQEVRHSDEITNSDKLHEMTLSGDGSKEVDVEVQSEPNTELEVELASPSQSQGSRATRWEALADIAAELPPSLAVDPLTGQIYALSK